MCEQYLEKNYHCVTSSPGFTFSSHLYKKEEDPKLIRLDLGTSTLGPLKENWSLKADQVMTEQRCPYTYRLT